MIRISFDSVSKYVIFKWGLNIVKLDLQNLSLSGITYINEFKVSDFELIKKFTEFDKNGHRSRIVFLKFGKKLKEI